MEEYVASTSRDFSELSVSENPTPSRKFEPIDFSSLRSGSIGFTARREGTNSDDCSVGNAAHYEHVIKFKGRLGSIFTVNDGPERDANDPKNAEFLESIKNYRIPEEFVEEGTHTIRVLRTRKASKEASGKFVPDIRFEESDEYAWFSGVS
ncbi:hypothetical protein MKW92_015844 [Papaver armeniacum]|nr:hypothetical protein MKW92_015844 [Papaver armeniacum]